MKLSVIGSGYVGLVTGACLAQVGHSVICVDNNIEKVHQLQSGKIPIYEPGLEELILLNVSTGRLRFTDSIDDAVANSEVLFICVSSPPLEDGSVDLSYVEKVSREIAHLLTDYRVIVDKSTVPVKTGEKVAEIIHRYNHTKAPFDVVSNPEFLREGTAVSDFMKPDRIVIGVNSPRAEEMMKSVYEPFKAPLLITDVNSAELIKHASNSFLALKISYINVIANICEASGADVTQVAEGMGMDHRIGRGFLNAGIGYGGSCFPKDVSAFIKIAEELGVDFDLLKEVEKINASQWQRLLKKVRKALWVLKEKKIGQLGLAFKKNTDDVRCSVSISLAKQMLEEEAEVSVYDPKAMETARPLLPNARYCQDPYEVAVEADAIIIATEWSEFADLNWEKIRGLMRVPLLFDGRNLLDPEKMKSLGFEYYSMGRP